MTEQTGLEYASTTGGDARVRSRPAHGRAGGAAHLLSARRDESAGSVVFMFQPGRRAGRCQAHDRGRGCWRSRASSRWPRTDPRVPPAAWAVGRTAPAPRFGRQLTSTSRSRRGRHGTQPHTAKDPVPALLEFGTALQTMVTRRFSVFDPAVASITSLAGEAINVIPAARSLGAKRSRRPWPVTRPSPPPCAKLARRHRRRPRCARRGGVDRAVPAHPQRRRGAWCRGEHPGRAGGEEHVRQDADLLTGSEDFSFALDQVPGCFFLERSPPDLDQENPAATTRPRRCSTTPCWAPRPRRSPSRVAAPAAGLIGRSLREAGPGSARRTSWTRSLRITGLDLERGSGGPDVEVLATTS
ncbi:hypothetical protein QJS66_21115 [Kocuria rhizophila]|nr:hypothetical protein QJS66_21115 [Kocuria rhizophila]